MAKKLELSDKQQEILADVLKNVLGDLRYEIANTDLSSFRDQLKEKREHLESIADQLED